MPLDVSKARKYYNRVDRFFDRTALREKQVFAHDLIAAGRPLTATEAFRHSLAAARRFDPHPQLKMIVCSAGLDSAGRSSRWGFSFDLPRRRAQASIDWILAWDENTDSYGKASIEGTVRPFPEIGGVTHRMVEDGDLLYRQLAGLWEKELKRLPALPHDFKDSDQAIRELARSGLDLSSSEVTLTAKGRHGSPPRWQAQTRHNTYETGFELGRREP